MATKPKPPVPCKQCGKPVERYYSKSGRLLMPVVCADCRPRWRHPRGTDHWHWRGGERSMKGEYVRVWVAPGKRDLEHRVAWERAYGPIPKGLHVHHVNDDKTDNRPENLMLANNKAHQALHRAARSLGTRWSLTHTCCVACQSTERSHKARGLCKLCYDRLHRAGLLK